MYKNSYRRSNSPETIGLGSILLPPDIERDQYVSQCLFTKKIDVVCDGGVSFKQCNVTNEVIQNLVFPESDTELGSKVLLLFKDNYTTPFVIGTINSFEEGSPMTYQDRVKKSQNNSVVSNLILSAKNALSFLSISSATKAVKLLLQAHSTEEGVVEIESSHKINIHAEEHIELQTEQDILIKVADSESEDDMKQINVTFETITFNDGELGGLINIEDLTKKLNDMISAINKNFGKFNTHAHPGGTAGPYPVTLQPPQNTDKLDSLKKDDYEDTTVIH